jgi:hypothetical protein
VIAFVTALVEIGLPVSDVLTPSVIISGRTRLCRIPVGRDSSIACVTSVSVPPSTITSTKGGHTSVCSSIITFPSTTPVTFCLMYERIPETVPPSLEAATACLARVRSCSFVSRFVPPVVSVVFITPVTPTGGDCTRTISPSGRLYSSPVSTDWIGTFSIIVTPSADSTCSVVSNCSDSPVESSSVVTIVSAGIVVTALCVVN